MLLLFIALLIVLLVALPLVSEKELTNKSGFFAIRVPGLTMQGYLTGSRLECGFLVICRAKGDDDDEGSSTITVRAKYYMENVLLPWIQQERQQCMPTWQTDDVLPELTALVMVDGQQQQLAALMSETMQVKLEEERINLVKLFAGATARAQAADVSPAFKSVKKVMRGVWADPHFTSGGFDMVVRDILRAARTGADGVKLMRGRGVLAREVPDPASICSERVLQPQERGGGLHGDGDRERGGEGRHAGPCQAAGHLPKEGLARRIRAGHGSDPGRAQDRV